MTLEIDGVTATTECHDGALSIRNVTEAMGEPVTANKGDTGARFNTRNAGDWLERSVNATAQEWRQHRLDAHRGLCCHQCGRVYEPGEKVYRCHYQCWNRIFKNICRRWPGLTCEACAPGWMKASEKQDRRWPVWQWAEEKPCDVCGRPVVQKEIYRRKHTFCCGGCEGRYYNQKEKARRAGTRTRTCPICGQGFTGTRADAVTCSPACRQKGYRRRVKVVQS